MTWLLWFRYHERRCERDMKSQEQKHAEFLRMAYCALVLRGYNKEREIPDAILRKVWRFGKRLQQSVSGKFDGIRR